MTYEELQTLKVGDRVWCREVVGPLGPFTGRRLPGSISTLNRFPNPATGQKDWVGRVTITTDDGQTHDVVASLVDRMSVLDKIAEVS